VSGWKEWREKGGVLKVKMHCVRSPRDFGAPQGRRSHEEY
jgi:hypothetical protein